MGLLLAPLPGHSSQVASAASVTAKAIAVQQVQVFVDGKKLSLSAPAYAENGITFVPMRDIFTALGAAVTWENNSETIIGRKGSLSISLKVGKKEAVINGKTTKLDAPAVVRNGVTFVPVRFISEALLATVKWDNAANAVRITSQAVAELEAYDKYLEAQKNIPKLTPAQLVDKYDESIVLIMTNYAQGSGIVIGENLVLTNYHVMTGASSATALTLYGDELKIEGVVSYNAKADLAIIKTAKAIDAPAVALGYGLNLHKGDKVVAIGSPLGLQNTVSDGLISNITLEGGVRYLQTNVPIDHGSSGGALFSEYGDLVGITTLGYPDTSAHLNFAVSVMHAAALFSEVTGEKVKAAKFLPPLLPKTLVGAPLDEIQKLLKDQYSSVSITKGEAKFTKWEAKRDSAGWLVLTADIDPAFYLNYGTSAESELRIWTLNLGYDLHSLLPDEKIQVLISFERDYGFEPRGLAAGEVTPIGGDKWRVRYPVINMQLKDQTYITTRF
nr:stalk domain-containing protein [Paenibacillus castaneae]